MRGVAGRAPAVALAMAGLVFAPTALASEGAPDPINGDLVDACGRGDDALAMLAASLAQAKLAGEALPVGAALTRALRDNGSDGAWPRWLARQGAPLDRQAVRADLAAWALTLPGTGPRRCGVGSARDATGRETIVAIAVRDLAQTTVSPRAPRPGQWVEVKTRLVVQASTATIVVLGPRGAPLQPPASFHEGVIVARFCADRAGVWSIQTLADLGAGPTPVAESRVVVGSPPDDDGYAPGEEAATPLAMTNVARQRENLTPLAGSAALDTLAAAHARQLSPRRSPTHDTGLGSPSDRVAAAGIASRSVGEVIAHAPTLSLAHRTLWASPAHRAALLSPRFSVGGQGVAHADDGSVWVVELFLQP